MNNSKKINWILLLSTMVTIAASWWISIYKQGFMYHFVWVLFIVSFIIAWTLCIKIFYKSYKNQTRLDALKISLLFDLIILHTVIGIWGMLLSSDEGVWHISDMSEYIPFWLYLMGIAYPTVFTGIYIKEKKIVKGIICIALSITLVVVGWILLNLWASGEIGIE